MKDISSLINLLDEFYENPWLVSFGSAFIQRGVSVKILILVSPFLLHVWQQYNIFCFLFFQCFFAHFLVKNIFVCLSMGHVKEGISSQNWAYSKFWQRNETKTHKFVIFTTIFVRIHIHFTKMSKNPCLF